MPLDVTGRLIRAPSASAGLTTGLATINGNPALALGARINYNDYRLAESWGLKAVGLCSDPGFDVHSPACLALADEICFG